MTIPPNPAETKMDAINKQGARTRTPTPTLLAAKPKGIAPNAATPRRKTAEDISMEMKTELRILFPKEVGRPL
jgi:hypothetical protein